MVGCGPCIVSQSLLEEAAADERSESDAAELRCVPQTQELAVVASFHQGAAQHDVELVADASTGTCRLTLSVL